MSWPLLRRTWRAQRVRLLVASIALAVWGFFLPLIYGAFGQQFRALFESGAIPKQFANFGGGDIFTLSGSIALGFIHPIAIIVVCVFAVGFSTAAVAGERQRGTLEVLLARPVSRRRLYATLLVSMLGFVALLVAALLVGNLIGAVATGVTGQLDLARFPLLWLNGVLLFFAIGAIGLAASVSFDRLAPAIGVTLAVVVVMYFLQVLGSLWPDAAFLQPWSLFDYLQAKAVLDGDARLTDLALLAAVAVAAIAFALVEFPRRDLAAPS